MPDVDAVTFDYMEWTHPRLHSAGKFFYEQWMKKLPSLYGYLFQKTRGENAFTQLVKNFRTYNLDRMTQLIREVNPTVVVCTFPPAAAAMSALKAEGLIDIPAVTVVTDHTDHSFWIHPYTDRYLVGSGHVRRALLRKGIPDFRIEVTGIPIRMAYSQSFDRESLKRRHHFILTLPTVLVMGGGLGMIDKRFTGMLKSQDFGRKIQFIIVCGRNRKLELELAEEMRNASNCVIVKGYIDHVHEFMALSDLIVTKPGGLTTSEALALRLPMLLYKPLPGQEKDNAVFLSEAGAAVEASSAAELHDQIFALMEDGSLLEEMRRRAGMCRHETPSISALQAI